MPSCCCGFRQLHQCREQLRRHGQQQEQRQGLYFISRPMGLTTHYFQCGFVFKVDGVDHALFWVGFCFQSRCDWRRTFLGHALFASTGNLPFFWILIWNRIRNFTLALLSVRFCFQGWRDWPRTILGRVLFSKQMRLTTHYFWARTVCVHWKSSLRNLKTVLITGNFVWRLHLLWYVRKSVCFEIYVFHFMNLS